jgi:hypothetical protein
MVGSLVRSLYARRRSPAAGGDLTLAVLGGARTLVSRGWVQGAWYVLEAPDGRRRYVGAGSLTRRGFGAIVQSCLVGAIVESARWQSPERGAAGPAIDAVWRQLGELTARRPPVDPRTPLPLVRSRQVGELTTWNDGRGRTADDVLALLEATIAGVSLPTGPTLPPSSPGRIPTQKSSASSAAARSAPSVGTGR